jgi:hypothetical protein
VDAAAVGQLASAGRIVLGTARAVNDSIALRGRGAEVREFARLMPVLEISLASVGLTLDAVIEPLPIKVAVCAPGTVVMGYEPQRDFPEPEIELGELARLDLKLRTVPRATRMVAPTAYEAGGTAGASLAINPAAINPAIRAT